MSIVNTFSLQSNRQIKINFDGGDLSSDAGLLLIKEFISKLGIEHKTMAGRAAAEKPSGPDRRKKRTASGVSGRTGRTAGNSAMGTASADTPGSFTGKSGKYAGNF